jgi:hypothetical protein
MIKRAMVTGLLSLGLAVLATQPGQARIVGNRIVLNLIAANRLAANRVVLNRLAANRIVTNALSGNSVSTPVPGDGAVLDVVGVVLPDGTDLRK